MPDRDARVPPFRGGHSTARGRPKAAARAGGKGDGGKVFRLTLAKLLAEYTAPQQQALRLCLEHVFYSGVLASSRFLASDREEFREEVFGCGEMHPSAKILLYKGAGCELLRIYGSQYRNPPQLEAE